MQLPKPTSGINPAYLQQLVRRLEQELDRRPVMIDGALVITPQQPLQIVTEGGEMKTVSVRPDGSLAVS